MGHGAATDHRLDGSLEGRKVLIAGEIVARGLLQVTPLTIGLHHFPVELPGVGPSVGDVIVVCSRSSDLWGAAIESLDIGRNGRRRIRVEHDQVDAPDAFLLVLAGKAGGGGKEEQGRIERNQRSVDNRLSGSVVATAVTCETRVREALLAFGIEDTFRLRGTVLIAPVAGYGATLKRSEKSSSEVLLEEGPAAVWPSAGSK